MTDGAIRKKLLDYLVIADDKKIKALYTLLEDEIERKSMVSIEQYNKELAESEAEFAKGNFISNASMKRQMKKW